MKSRALKSATADLFAAVPAPHQPPLPAAAPPPPLERAARPPSKHLWYAVVFPQLQDPQQSSVMLQRLALHAQQFTPWVSIEMPNALLLEIQGSVKLFGSLEKLQADIDAVWHRLKFDAHSASAPSTLAALWLARAGKRALIEDAGLLAGTLAKLPLACTAWDAERLHTLRAMGVMHVGELLRLPRAGIARRFGAAAVLDLDRVLARQAAPRRAFVPRERFRERCDFETEVETVEYLLKALEPLTARCARFLRERQAGVQALELRLKHRGRAATRVRLGLASITSERRRLADVLVQKISQLELAAPILRMELISGPLQPLSAGLSRCLRARLERPGRPRYGAAAGGALACPSRRESGLWNLYGSGTSAGGGLAARACASLGRRAACRRPGAQGRSRHAAARLAAG